MEFSYCLFYFGVVLLGIVSGIFLGWILPNITTDIIKARKTVEGKKTEANPSTWGYRDFIVNNTVIDEKFRVVEIDLTDYDLSREEIIGLRDNISGCKFPYASIVRIKTKDGKYNHVSSLFYYISGGDYSYSLDDFRDTIELIRMNNNFTFKDPGEKDERYRIMRDLYILTGIKETSVLGGYTKKKATYYPWFDQYYIK